MQTLSPVSISLKFKTGSRVFVSLTTRNDLKQMNFSFSDRALRRQANMSGIHNLIRGPTSSHCYATQFYNFQQKLAKKHKLPAVSSTHFRNCIFTYLVSPELILIISVLSRSLDGKSGFKITHSLHTLGQLSALRILTNVPRIIDL